MRLAIADDSALIRERTAEAVLPAHGFEIVAAAANGPALLESIAQTRPDVVLLDIRMPPTYTNEGITAATTIRDQHPGANSSSHST